MWSEVLSAGGSSPATDVARKPSSTAVLINGPSCHRENTESGTLSVEATRCQSVDLSESLISSKPSLFLFGGANKTNEPQMEEHELKEKPSASTGTSINNTNERQHVSQKDVLSEYGYKYEFFDKEQDGNCLACNQEEEDDTEEQVDDEEDEQLVDQSSSYIPLLHTDVSTTFYAANMAQQTGHPPNNNAPRVYLLGKSYDPTREYEQRRDDELSLFWFTYRCDFPEIAPYRITSDAGWGCMLRSAQMMLAQTLRLHFKGRQWRSHRFSLAQQRRDPFIRSLLTWMADFPSSGDNYYSLHNMVAAGLSKYEILPGEWYGPGSACHVVRDLVQAHETRQLAILKRKHEAGTENQSSSSNPKSARIFRVYVAAQGTVYRDAVRDLMTQEGRSQLEEAKKQAEAAAGPKNQPAHPLATAEEEQIAQQLEAASLETLDWDTGMLLLIPLRPGLKGINEDYAKSIAHTFSLPQSVGVLGGRPRGARWFYGATADGSRIFGLDPHIVQTSPRRRTAKVNGRPTQVIDISEEYLRSVHTTGQEEVPLPRMDPSIALGFYCRTQQDLDHLRESMKQWKTLNPNLPELFTFADKSPDYARDMDDLMMGGDMTGSLLDDEESAVSDEEDFVFL